MLAVLCYKRKVVGECKLFLKIKIHFCNLSFPEQIGVFRTSCPPLIHSVTAQVTAYGYLELAQQLKTLNLVFANKIKNNLAIKLEHKAANLVKLTRLRTKNIVAIHDSLVVFNFAFMLSNP